MQDPAWQEWKQSKEDTETTYKKLRFFEVWSPFFHNRELQAVKGVDNVPDAMQYAMNVDEDRANGMKLFRPRVSADDGYWQQLLQVSIGHTANTELLLERDKNRAGGKFRPRRGEDGGGDILLYF